jgi:YVTN family beta-propeller protein
MRRLVFVIALLAVGCTSKDESKKGAGGERGGDGAGERVYVTDEVGGVVVVIDASKDEVVARIPVGKRPRGVRASPDGTRVYVALSGSPKSPPGTDPSTPGSTSCDTASCSWGGISTTSSSG